MGTLIDPALKISTDYLYYEFYSAWEDENGDVYVKLDTEGKEVIVHPDGRIASPAQVGRHRWRDGNGDVYVSNGHLTVIHPDGTTTSFPGVDYAWKAWTFGGNLYVAGEDKIEAFSPNEVSTSTSTVIDLREKPVRLIRWNAEIPEGSSITVQTRTGEIRSYWRENFEAGELPEIESAGGGWVDLRVEEGKLIFDASYQRISHLIDTGIDFLPGSIITARVRVKSYFGEANAYLFTDDAVPDRATLTPTVVSDRWVILSYVSNRDFRKIGFLVPRGAEVFDVDWISVESFEGWTEWIAAKNPDGSVIPSLDADHPYLQWRAIFTTEDPVEALPTLEDVTLVSGYPPRGIYISPAFDTQASSVFKTISWDADMPQGTSLKLQIRTASPQEDLQRAPWLGPTADEELYIASGTAINPIHNGDTWIQYKILFETKEEMRTPVLMEVKIEYEVPTTLEENIKQTVPHVTCLDQNYPNPFNSETIIRYQLSETERIRLSVYNVFGQEVKRLMDDQRLAGYYTATWDGRDTDGKVVANGIYFCEFRTEEYTQVKKMVLLR